jgi:rhomboid protease GluP
MALRRDDLKHSYPVKFFEPPPNSFRLRGNGAIAIDGDKVIVNGRSRASFRFGKQVSIDFPLADVRNVLQDGKMVRFEVPSAASSPFLKVVHKGMHPFVAMVAHDEVAASRLADDLGAARTVEFAEALQEHADFQERLQETTAWPYMTVALVAINVIVFVLMGLDGAGIMAPEGRVHVRWGSNYGALTTSGEWWRLLTSMFLHFGIIHLGFNMLTLWDIGRIVERLFGNWIFLLAYLLSGISGAMLSLLVHPQVNSAGASGAIFGVFGMLAAYLLRKELGVPTSVMKSHWRIALPFIGYNLFIGATVPFIDNSAHIGGLVGGFALGFALARPLDKDRRRFSRERIVVVTVAMLASAILAAFSLARKSEPAPDMCVRDSYEAIAREDAKLRDRVTAYLQRLEGSGITPEASSRFVREEVAQQYLRWSYDVSVCGVRDGSPERPIQQLLIRYTGLRGEGYRLLADGMAAKDPALFADSEAKFRESSRVLKELELTPRPW